MLSLEGGVVGSVLVLGVGVGLGLGLGLVGLAGSLQRELLHLFYSVADLGSQALSGP